MKRNYPLECLFIACALLLSSVATAAPANQVKLDSLEAAIQHLNTAYPQSYQNSGRLLSKLEALRGVEGDAFEQGFAELQRTALLGHPDLQKYTLVFVEREQYPRDHHNTGTIFQTGEANHRSVHKILGSQIAALRLSDGT